jgi:hypothetical protein
MYSHTVVPTGNPVTTEEAVMPKTKLKLTRDDFVQMGDRPFCIKNTITGDVVFEGRILDVIRLGEHLIVRVWPAYEEDYKREPDPGSYAKHIIDPLEHELVAGEGADGEVWMFLDTITGHDPKYRYFQSYRHA